MYEDMIESSLVYIEENLSKEITLKSISDHFNMSRFHFSRIFSFLVGEPLRQYVLRRKINHSLKRLENNESIISIAYYYGFSHPESYSRAFKQVFGISPKKYQLDHNKLESLNIGKIISRDLVNFKGNLLIRCEYEYHENCLMVGDETCIDLSDTFWINEVSLWGEQFLSQSKELDHIEQQYFYNQVECVSGTYQYKIKILRKLLSDDADHQLKRFVISGGWYAKFHYEGNISEYYDCLENDINKWIKNKDEKLERVGNGFLVRYSISDMDQFDIFVRLNRIMKNEFYAKDKL